MSRNYSNRRYVQETETETDATSATEDTDTEAVRDAMRALNTTGDHANNNPAQRGILDETGDTGSIPPQAVSEMAGKEGMSTIEEGREEGGLPGEGTRLSGAPGSGGGTEAIPEERHGGKRQGEGRQDGERQGEGHSRGSGGHEDTMAELGVYEDTGRSEPRSGPTDGNHGNRRSGGEEGEETPLIRNNVVNDVVRDSPRDKIPAEIIVQQSTYIGVEGDCHSLQSISSEENSADSQGRLPPLQDARTKVPTVRVALPNIGEEARTPTAGSRAERAAHTIVSVPEGGGMTPKMTEAGIVSVPGEEGRTRGAPQGRNKERLKPVECVIYFMDKSGLHLTVEDGQNAEAGELFEMVMDEMSFPAEARDVFSLWLVSDLLELQLKPHHIPFKLACYWEELLEKYTTASEEDQERDEPVIMFQRNCFYPRYLEKKLTDQTLIRLLFIEAKENIIDARYPISSAEADKLAGLQALIGFKYFKEDHHTPEFYKQRLTDFYPAHIANKRKMKIPGRSVKENPEYRLVEWHDKAFKKFGPIRNDDERYNCHIKYLEFCWKLPYYGAAFFNGQIEHPGGTIRITDTPDDPVYVAINPDGVFIIDMDDVIFLLGLLYEDMSWQYAEPKDSSNKNALPCIFLQFKDKENGQMVTKVLQVFSREAILMSSMIGACIEYRKANKKLMDRSDTLKALDGDGDGVIEGANKESWKEFNRLCLQVFDKDGKCIKEGIRKK